MRNIKFRAWWSGELFEGLPLEKILNLASRTGYPPYPETPVVFEQFIGVYDKNAVEIYTGDIIRDHIGIGIVEYVDHKAAFRNNYLNGQFKWFIDYVLKGERESIEVIGNVHQNIELLGVDRK